MSSLKTEKQYGREGLGTRGVSRNCDYNSPSLQNYVTSFCQTVLPTCHCESTVKSIEVSVSLERRKRIYSHL
jgi:hypothetical protein